jgi:hypothetical protein
MIWAEAFLCSAQTSDTAYFASQTGVMETGETDL